MGVFSKCLQMEDCMHLVCETLGVCEEGEVGVNEICHLYQKVFLLPATLDDTKRAITQVGKPNGGMSCAGRNILHVLLVMERERESREELYWELQMLKSGRICPPARVNPQTTLQNSPCNLKDGRVNNQWNISSLLGKARRSYMRLDLEGVQSFLQFQSPGDVARRQGWMRPTSSDILQLLQYKYELIKERLYREMLMAEYGVTWWESITSQEQMDCLCELGGAVEQAFKQMDMLRLCELPGALHCYRSGGQVVLQSCGEAIRSRDQAWTPKPCEEAWSAVVFYSELESLYQEERDSLTMLLNRVDRTVLREMYVSMCMAVRRAERETQSYAALLVARQHWEKWPYTGGLVSQELIKLWLQEKRDSNKSLQHQGLTTGCTLQALLQTLVLCQEQERRRLLEILHTLSLEELQDQSYTLPRNYTAVEDNAAGLRQGCVLSLRQTRASLEGAQSSATGPLSTHCPVSWADCAVHLLTQLTLAQENETWMVLHTLPDMDAHSLMALLHKYQSELQSPKLHNLCEVVQPLLQTYSVREPAAAQPGVSTDVARADQRRDLGSDMQEICTGCGVFLVPEDAPYLEILGPRNQRDPESAEEMEGGEEEEKKDERKNERGGEMRGVKGEMRKFGREDKMEESEERTDLVREARIVGSLVRREGREERREIAVEIDLERKEKREGSSERSELKREEDKEGGDDRRPGVEKSRDDVMVGRRDGTEVTGGVEESPLEKQGSLITLAWSRKADGVNKEQKKTSALQEEESASKILQEEKSAKTLNQNNPQQSHGDTPDHGAQSCTHWENCDSPQTETTEELTLVRSLEENFTPSEQDAQHEGNMEGSPSAQGMVTENPKATGQAHMCEDDRTEGACGEQKSGPVCGEVCEEPCEELRLQREATMRSLVHMQRKAELRWQRDRDRQLLRVQERLSIIQNRKSDEDLLGLTQKDTFKQLTNTLLQEDEQHQKTLVREKLQQLRRERSYILQSRRERNTAGFKELLAPTAQTMTNAEDGLL